MTSLSCQTETRKQREIRDRERKILEVARRHLLQSGYLGLNMDRIAAEIEYSKGTIYQHFRNKEEILLALANEALDTRFRMFCTAAECEGPARVRMSCVGAACEAFVEHFPHFFMVEQLVRASSIWEKTSPERRELMESCERRCMAKLVQIVRDGVDAGDLTLPEGVMPEEVVFGFWSVSLGAQTISHTSHTLDEIGINNPVVSLHRSQSAMLDGYGWKPLSSDFDYSAHVEQTKEERFRHDQFA